MHIAEGILPLPHALAWSALAASALAFSARRPADPAAHGDAAARRALLSMAGALTFAVTLFPIPVPIAGVTSHLCATPVLALLLGPRRMILPATLSLLLQALFFAHGGLTTLGANVVTLGVIGPFAAYALATALRRVGVPAIWAVAIACAFADVAVYVADAAILGLAFAGERSFASWFTAILAGFAPAQVPLALVEGVASALFLRALSRRRPALVPPRLRVATASASAAEIALCLALAPRPALAAPYPGLDEAVIEASAARAGRPAQPLFDLGGGDAAVGLWMLGSFLAGWIGGASWRALVPVDAAPQREGERAHRP
jgi:cobalt/nickel transport system permease protein